MSGGIFKPLVDILQTNDRYYLCADFASYVAEQQRAADVWTNAEEWTRKSILNTARSGFLSSDRTIAEYAQDIWDVPVRNGKK